MEYLNMDSGQLWDDFVGSQTVKEFMATPPNDTIEEAVDSYINESDFFKDLEENEVDYIKDQLINYIIECAEEWAEKREKSFNCSFKQILESRILLNSKFDDSARDEDFRVLRIMYFDNLGSEILEIYDLQCYNMRIEDEEPYWESIIRYSGYEKPHQIEMIQNKIKKLIDRSKVFSIRINREENEVETNKKINDLILKIKEYKK